MTYLIYTHLGNRIETEIWIGYNWPINRTVAHNYGNILIDVVID